MNFGLVAFVVELWHDLLTSMAIASNPESSEKQMLTLMAVASNPESSEKQIPHSRLLINMTVQSVQQIRWQPE